MNKKVILIELDIINEFHVDHYYIYHDSTYRCRGWPNGEYSQYKIIDDMFWFKHVNQSQFYCDNNSNLGKLVVNRLFEKEFLK